MQFAQGHCFVFVTKLPVFFRCFVVFFFGAKDGSWLVGWTVGICFDWNGKEDGNTLAIWWSLKGLHSLYVSLDTYVHAQIYTYIKYIYIYTCIYT